MLQALIHNRKVDRTNPSFDDVVEGKGQGLIVLLQYVAGLMLSSVHLLWQWPAWSGENLDG